MDVRLEIINTLNQFATPVTVTVASEYGRNLIVVTAGWACGKATCFDAAAARCLAHMYENTAATPEEAPPAEDRSNGHQPASVPEPVAEPAPAAARRMAYDKVTGDQLARIREMLDTHTTREICEELGLPLGTVGYHASKMRKEVRSAEGLHGDGFPVDPRAV